MNVSGLQGRAPPPHPGFSFNLLPPPFPPVLDDDTVKCFGANLYGSLGLGDLVPRGVAPGEMGDNLPALPLTFGEGGGSVSNVFAGTFHTCVTGTEGGLAAFGWNHQGQVRVVLCCVFCFLLRYLPSVAPPPPWLRLANGRWMST